MLTWDNIVEEISILWKYQAFQLVYHRFHVNWEGHWHVIRSKGQNHSIIGVGWSDNNGRFMECRSIMIHYSVKGVLNRKIRLTSHPSTLEEKMFRIGAMLFWHKTHNLFCFSDIYMFIITLGYCIRFLRFVDFSRYFRKATKDSDENWTWCKHPDHLWFFKKITHARPEHN